MFRSISLVLGTLVLASLALAGQKGAEKPASLLCTLTGSKIEKCCCEKREGKLYCTLAKKTIEKCCCVTAGAKQKGSKG
jgi:hypothetical protein